MNKALAVLVVSLMLFARTKDDYSGNRPFQIIVQDTNNVQICISNYGKFGQTAACNADCWWPKGSGYSYIFGAGLWFSTVDSITGDTLVTIGYGPHGAETEFAPGLSGMAPGNPKAIIYLSSANWPPPAGVFPMAPQEILSHEDSWCCFNDSDSVYHIPNDTRPIGIEVYQTVYEWTYPILEDMVFFKYEIKNVTDHTLYDCYLGIVFDCDIGNEAAPNQNDICNAIIGKWYVINCESIWVDNLAYQWQQEFEPGWAEFPGVVGVDLLQTPFDLQEGQDKDNDGILDQYERDSAYYVNNLPFQMWDVDNDGLPDWRDASENPQLEMTAYKRFTLNLEPNKDNERYLTLAGYNFRTGQYEPYDTITPPPDDQRFLLSTGPFNLLPDSVITIVFALILAQWHDIYQTPDTALVLVDKWAQWHYDLNWSIGIYENARGSVLSDRISIKPNPVSNSATITFTLRSESPVSVKIYNSLGQLVRVVLNQIKPKGIHSVNCGTSGLPAGSYFVLFDDGCRRKVIKIMVIK
ncbi:MAG: T9SS type A sorting domain-containing protein [candidate division WOR-3 bacterium]